MTVQGTIKNWSQSIRIFFIFVLVLGPNEMLCAQEAHPISSHVNVTYTQDDSESKASIPLMATTFVLGATYLGSLGIAFIRIDPDYVGKAFVTISAIAAIVITPFLVAWRVTEIKKEPVIGYTLTGFPYTPATVQIDSSNTFSNSPISYWKTKCKDLVQGGKSPIQSCLIKDAGEHSIVVGARDYDGDYSQHSQTVTIHDGKPNVEFACAFEPSSYAPTELTCLGTPTSPHHDADLKATWFFSNGKKDLGNTAEAAASMAIPQPGTYLAKLVVTDRFGQTSSTAASFTASDATPVANPSCKLTPYSYAPTNMSCTASWISPDPSVKSLTFHWDLGTLGTFHSASGSVQVPIERAGSYPAQLQVEDSRRRLSNIARTSLTALYAFPLARLATNFSNIYHSAPLNVTLDSTASSATYVGDYIVSVEWNIDEIQKSGSIEEFGVLEHLFDTAGTHVVKVRVTDNRGFVSNWQTFPITINSRNPIVSVKVTASNDGHAPALVELDPGSSTPNYPGVENVRYDWTSFFPVFDGLTTYPPRGAVKEWLVYQGKYWAVVTVIDSANYSSSARVDFTLLP